MNVSILKNSEVNTKRRKSQVDSMNREMKSIQLNSAQDKLLEINNQKLDKELNKEYRCSRQTALGLKQEQDNINKRTPSAETWLRQHEGQYETWKAQERAKLLKRHKSLIKSYRVPSQEACDREMQIVRSKTFVARDKSKDRDNVQRSRQSALSRAAERHTSTLLRRHSVAVSEVSSRRSSVASSVS